MILFSCRVRGKAEPKQSAKFARIGKHVRAYQPRKVENYAAYLRSEFAAEAEARGLVPIDEPVDVEIVFVLDRPKSRPKRCKHPDRKPDLDNLEKPVLDALEKAGVLTNDSRICGKATRKVYGDQPGLEVLVFEMSVL